MKITKLSANRLNNLSYSFHKKFADTYECRKEVERLGRKGLEVRVISVKEGITQYFSYHVYTRKKYRRSNK